MKLTDFFNVMRLPAMAVCGLVCFLITYQVAAAKSTVTVTNAPPKSEPLILDLPANELLTDSSTVIQQMPKDAINDQALITATHKKRPVGMDCGVDVYQDTRADIALTSRLTGVCDLKYHY
jgi:hypothetical protein